MYQLTVKEFVSISIAPFLRMWIVIVESIKWILKKLISGILIIFIGMWVVLIVTFVAIFYALPKKILELMK